MTIYITLDRTPAQMPTFETSPHYSEGRLPIAFVFSAPGGKEALEGRPIAGDTGENLSFALSHLYAIEPTVFQSRCRYDYRITNAHTRPIAASLGHAASEATSAQILAPLNLSRIYAELEGCSLVVLCGLKSQLLAAHISTTRDVTLLCAWHTGNKALNSKYNVEPALAIKDPFERRKQRAVMWAKDLLLKLTAR